MSAATAVERHWLILLLPPPFVYSNQSSVRSAKAWRRLDPMAAWLGTSCGQAASRRCSSWRGRSRRTGRVPSRGEQGRTRKRRCREGTSPSERRRRRREDDEVDGRRWSQQAARRRSKPMRRWRRRAEVDVQEPEVAASRSAFVGRSDVEVAPASRGEERGLGVVAGCGGCRRTGGVAAENREREWGFTI